MAVDLLRVFWGLGGVLLAAAAALAVRWRVARTDVLGRANRFPIVRIGLCVVLAALLLGDAALHARTERRLSAAASSVARFPVRVHCQGLLQAVGDLGPELGRVRFDAAGAPERGTLLTRGTCGHLSAWLRSAKADPTLDEVIAVHVLTHETMHMTGTTDEAVAECRAMQHDTVLAERLGATAAQARALARRYWREVYPRMPDAYRTAACVPGGALDEHRPDPPWVR